MLTDKQKEAIREAQEVKANQKKERDAIDSLNRNGIEVFEYTEGNTMYQYILDPKDTEHGAGNFLWGLLDFLVKHRDYVILPKADFIGKKAERKFINAVRP